MYLNQPHHKVLWAASSVFSQAYSEK